MSINVNTLATTRIISDVLTKEGVRIVKAVPPKDLCGELFIVELYGDTILNITSGDHSDKQWEIVRVLTQGMRVNDVISRLEKVKLPDPSIAKELASVLKMSNSRLPTIE